MIYEKSTLDRGNIVSPNSFDWYCHLYCLCLLRQTRIFLVADSQKLFFSPQRAHVTFFVKCDKLELAFWLLCSVHAVIQVPPDGVVGSRNCRCHSFAACTVDVTVCFLRQDAQVQRFEQDTTTVKTFEQDDTPDKD